MLDMFSRLIHVHVSGKIEWSVHVVQSAEHGFCTHPHCTCQKITIRLRVDERLFAIGCHGETILFAIPSITERILAR